MLLSLSGASGSGKSTALRSLMAADLSQRIACVEFDSIGVPIDADTAWRHSAVEHWVQAAVTAQSSGKHFLLCGQVPSVSCSLPRLRIVSTAYRCSSCTVRLKYAAGGCGTAENLRRASRITSCSANGSIGTRSTRLIRPR